MGIFDFLKNKKEPEKHYDPLNIQVTDLEKGYLLEYDLETWTVTKMSEYDWGSNYFTREFNIETRGKLRFLHIENDDQLVITLSEKLKFRKLENAVHNAIESTGKPPKKISHKNVDYFLDEESPGFYRNVENEDWEELISYSYLDEDEKKCLSIEQWGETSFEASIGTKIKPFDISNILPSPTN